MNIKYRYTLNISFLACAISRVILHYMILLQCGKCGKLSKACNDLDPDQTVPNIKLILAISHTIKHSQISGS